MEKQATQTNKQVSAAQSRSANGQLAPELISNPILQLQKKAGNRAVLNLLGPMVEPQSAADPAKTQRPNLSAAALSVQRVPNGRGSEASPQNQDSHAAASFIVEDNAESLAHGQMHKSEFLAQLRASVCRTADEELQRAGQTAKGCPYIEKWLAHYRDKDPVHIERALRKYAPEAARATTAREYIPAVENRVRRAINNWARTGEITGVPDELKGLIPGAGGGLAGMIGGAVSSILSGIGSALSSAAGAIGGAFASIGRALFKGKEGRAPANNSPRNIQSRLGTGQPLEGSVRSRMSSAFGHDFSNVRVHTETHDAAMSESLNARAFTIGSDIAFGSGEYQPGTLVGDALLAHELAHVVQQRNAQPAVVAAQVGNHATEVYEAEADVAAANAVAGLHGLRTARPTTSLLSAPRPQSCGKKPPQIRVPFGASLTEQQADQLLASDPVIWPRIKNRVAKGVKAEGHTRELGSEAYLYAEREKVFKDKLSLRQTSFQMMNAGGFAQDGEIYLHRKDAEMLDVMGGPDRGPVPIPPSRHPATIGHDDVHLYGSGAWVTKTGRAGNEGTTEYFTRRVLSKQKNPEIEGGEKIFERDSYPDEYEAVKCLAKKANDELLADAFFLGTIDPLRKKVGEAKFDAWATAMTNDNYNGAYAALGSKPPAKKKED